MGQWQPKRIRANEINGGNEFQGGEPLNNRDFNAVYENALKDAEMLDGMQMQLDGPNNVAPTVSITYDPVTNIPTLHFTNTAAAPFWLSAVAPIDNTLNISDITNPLAIRGFVANDLVFITAGVEQGNFYRITAVNETTLTVTILTTLRGIRGSSVFTTTAQLNEQGNTVIQLNTIGMPSYYQLLVNDMVISINAVGAGVIGKVIAINGNDVTVSFVSSMSGKADIIKLSLSELLLSNPVIGKGVFVLDTTRNVLKLGTGETQYLSLDKIATVQDQIEITYFDWNTISEISKSGRAKNFFKIGDRKIIRYNGVDLHCVIVGFNHDDLASGGKAGITFMIEELIPTTYPMNSSNTTSGGWNGSVMRTSTMPTILNQLPSDLRAVIKPVIKKSSSGNGSSTIQNTTDSIFLFSEVEISNTTTYSYAGEGTQYEYWRNKTDADRIKYLNGTATNWWLRSPSNFFGLNHYTYFVVFDSSGAVNGYIASNSRGVCFGFCV